MFYCKQLLIISKILHGIIYPYLLSTNYWLYYIIILPTRHGSSGKNQKCNRRRKRLKQLTCCTITHNINSEVN